MNEKALIFQRIKQISRGTVLIDEPLMRHTSFKIGGPADLFIRPADFEDLIRVREFCRAENIPGFVIGNGTNLLVSDEGFRGAVIDLTKTFNSLSNKGNVVTVGSGVSLNALIEYCTEIGLSGLESLIGIPGQVGGGLMMNAGAYGTEIMDTILTVRMINGEGQQEIWKRNEIQYGYRHTNFPESAVLIEAQFMLQEGNPKAMAVTGENILKKRKDKQPLSLPSAGSVFKRPQNDFAGRLIEESGCKGLRIGDAMVSRKHANFIVNCHLATARDVLRLIKEVRDRVYKQFDIMLELEIHLIGFEAI